MTVAEAAAALGVSDATIRREIRDGRLAALRVRGAVRITKQDLREYMTKARLAARGPSVSVAPPRAPWER